MIPTTLLLAQGALMAIVILQAWQNMKLNRSLRGATINCLNLSGRLSASLSIASVMMQYLARAEDNDHASMVLTNDTVKEMHRAYFYATSGELMSEDV